MPMDMEIARRTLGILSKEESISKRLSTLYYPISATSADSADIGLQIVQIRWGTDALRWRKPPDPNTVTSEPPEPESKVVEPEVFEDETMWEQEVMQVGEDDGEGQSDKVEGIEAIQATVQSNGLNFDINVEVREEDY
ncbi:hypothetical protein R1sor_017070 [Riccia sorocarpa]|uniref:Uncharacterized protein n=1 Tax=Riccia sorocarpa TaxID=122646 RepID=A0ABD3I5Q8_9MARC